MPQDPDAPEIPIIGPFFNLESFRYKYIWQTRGENCPLCDALEGRVYTFDRWFSTSLLPGFHLNCDCSLKLVDISIPESDLDFFGSDILLYTDRMFRFRWWAGFFTPYNWLFTEEISKFSREGKPVGEALRQMKAENRSGFFFRSNPYGIDHYQWRVFKTFRFFQDRENHIHSINHRPRAGKPHARWPWATYHTYNPRSYKPGYKTLTIKDLRKKYRPALYGRYSR